MNFFTTKMAKGLEISIMPEEYFRLSNGRVLKNLYELVNALKSIDDATFNLHVDGQKNDFGNWIRDVFKDEELAKSVFNLKAKEDIAKAIESKLIAKPKSSKKEADKILKKSVKSYKSSFAKNPAKSFSKKAQTQKEPQNQKEPQKEFPSDRIEEILVKEKEIEKREEKIEEIEARIEKELVELNAKKNPKFFSKEFVQGLAIGLLSALIIGLSYLKFFA